MVEMMEFCPLKKFRSSPENLLAYCQAHLQSKFYNPAKILNIVNRILEKNPDSAEAVLY